MIGHLPTKTGMVGATPIIADVHSGALTGGELVKIILTADYARDPAPGFLLGGTPAGTLAGTNPTVGARVLPIGTFLDLPKCEADALVSAGAATVI